MVDKLNPTNQFHPYQPTDAVPHSQSGLGGLGSLGGLNGIKDMLKGVDVRGSLDKARNVARNNPGAVLGGLAALVIGAGLMRRRSMNKAV